MLELLASTLLAISSAAAVMSSAEEDSTAVHDIAADCGLKQPVEGVNGIPADVPSAV